MASSWGAARSQFHPSRRWKGVARAAGGRCGNAARPCGRRQREPALASQRAFCFGPVPSNPLSSQPHQQLCHLCRLQAAGNGKTVWSRFVRASIPAGSKAWKGPGPSPMEAWRSLPASGSSSGREGSPPAVLPRGWQGAGRARGRGRSPL